MNRRESLFEQLAQEQDAIRRGAGHRDRAFERLFRTPSRAPWSGKRLASLGVAAAACLALALFWRHMAEPRPLVARVVGASEIAPTGVWLGAPKNEQLALEFSDGTQAKFDPDSETRIVSLTSRGGEVELKRGRVFLKVVPRPGANWRLSAGPFGVVVTGTQFEVQWNPEADTLVVVLQEGKVKLTGCGFGSGRPLVAGQTARARCQGELVSIGYSDDAEFNRKSARLVGARDDLATTRPAAEASGPAADARRDKAAGETAAASARPAASIARHGLAKVQPETEPAPPSDWKPLAAQGKYAEAFRAANAAGFGELLERAAPDDLLLLAQVAQRAGAPAQAERAFAAARRRFPRSPEASLAAFALGRLSFDTYNAYAKAGRWFRTYLNEQPSGAFAREALGRLMEANSRTANTDEARRLAHEYLERYPKGPHAALATRIATRR